MDLEKSDQKQSKDWCIYTFITDETIISIVERRKTVICNFYKTKSGKTHFWWFKNFIKSMFFLRAIFCNPLKEKNIYYEGYFIYHQVKNINHSTRNTLQMKDSCAMDNNWFIEQIDNSSTINSRISRLTAFILILYRKKKYCAGK